MRNSEKSKPIKNRSQLIKGFITVIIFALTTQAVFGSVQEAKGSRASMLKNENRRQLFGISLRHQAVSLLNEIELRYKHPVVEQRHNKLTQAATLGEGDVDMDGHPVIRLSERGLLLNRDLLEDLIVHELFHLKLLADGFPALNFRMKYNKPPSFEDEKQNQKVFKTLRIYFYDPILHWIFYPRMREMGFDPGQKRKNIFREMLKKNDTSELKIDFARVEYYFGSALEFGDPMLLKRLEDWFTQNGWYQALQDGKALVSIVKSNLNATKTRENAIKALLECFSYVNSGEVIYDTPQWNVQRRGDFDLNYVTITIKLEDK